MSCGASGFLVRGGLRAVASGWCSLVGGGGPPLHFFSGSMAIHGEARGTSIRARFRALKGELQHLVLSFSDDFQ